MNSFHAHATKPFAGPQHWSSRQVFSTFRFAQNILSLATLILHANRTGPAWGNEAYVDWMEMDLTDTVLMAQHPCAEQQRQEILTAFAPLLKRVARMYQDVAGYDEAYQEACLGLLRAIATYRPEAGPFPAYAKARVHGDVRTAMRRLWTAAARQAFAPPAFGEDESAPHDIGDTLAHVIAAMTDGTSDDAVDRCLLQDVIARLAACAGLSARERIWLRAALSGQTTEELANVHGVSYDTAKTWRRRGMEKLRQAAARAGLTASEVL